MESGSHGNAHLVGDFSGTTAEFERHIDMHHIHALEGGAEQRVAGFGELHELLGGHPRDERHLIHARRIFGRPYTDKPHMMALPLQFRSPLQGRIGGAVTLIAHRIDHKSDSQRTINALFNPVFAHCLILNHRAAMASAALHERV